MRILALDSLRLRLPLAAAAAPPPAEVSLPWNFRHEFHVGVDPATGVYTGLPTKWRMLLEEQPEGLTAPIRDKELPTSYGSCSHPARASSDNLAPGCAGAWTLGETVKSLFSGSPSHDHASAPEEISLPYNVQQHTHVSWDPDTQRFLGLPKEWAIILDNDGSESDTAV